MATQVHKPAPGKGASTPGPPGSEQPFALWIFLNLIIPTAPITIQYGMQWLHIYEVKFPQEDYLMMLFGLALATLIEYRRISAVIYGCIIPALVASVLYTAFILNEHNDAVASTIELRAFQFWVVLLLANVMRVALEGIRRWKHDT